MNPVDTITDLVYKAAAKLGAPIDKLCYVEPPFAYFTTQALDQQWGDDWNDAPYEHNAGKPYEFHEPMDGELERKPWGIYKLAYECDSLYTPAQISHKGNSDYSVEMINKGLTPWLASWPLSRTPRITIMAGVTGREFKRLIRLAGGTVYLPSYYD